MSARTRGAVLAVLWVVGGASAAVAQQGADAPRAREVLRSMGDFLQATKNFSFHGEINYDTIEQGQMVQLAGAVDVVASKPSRLHVHFRDDVSERKLWYEGTKLTLLDPVNGFYAVESVPGDLDQMVEHMEDRFGLRLPLGQLVTDGAQQLLASRIRRALYVGIHDVDGTACHHLAFVMDEVDVQVWVEVGSKPVPRKLVVDYKTLRGSPQYMASLMDWSFEAPKRGVFTAKIPVDADRIRFLALKAEGIPQ